MNRAADAPQPVTVSLKQGRAARAVATVLSVEELQPDGILDRRTEEVAVDKQGTINLRLPQFGIVLVDMRRPRSRCGGRTI